MVGKTIVQGLTSEEIKEAHGDIQEFLKTGVLPQGSIVKIIRKLKIINKEIDESYDRSYIYTSLEILTELGERYYAV